MTSKWASNADDKSDVCTAPQTSTDPAPSEDKIGAVTRSRRPRRPRLGDDQATTDAKGNVIERPAIKTIKGGWGLGSPTGFTSNDAQSKTADSMANMQDVKELQELSARPMRKNYFDNDDTEILVIPDLDDGGEEDIVSKVAVAPKNTTRRVPSLRELDEDLKYSVPSTADGLDMSLLTKTLVPPEMLEEDDSVWDFDGLLQAVTQEFNAQAQTDESAADARGSRNDLPQLRGGKSAVTSRLNRALVA